MTAQDLIEILNGLEDPQNTEIRMAIQPNWPFEHAIDGAIFNQDTDPEEDPNFPDRDDYQTTQDYLQAVRTYEEEHPQKPANPQPILYLTDGGQINYLPGDIAAAAGW